MGNNLYLCNTKQSKSMKLVIMTKSTFFVEEDKIISLLFEEGLDSLHISKADNSPTLLGTSFFLFCLLNIIEKSQFTSILT